MLPVILIVAELIFGTRFIIFGPIHGSYALEVDIYPASRLNKRHDAPLLKVHLSHAGEECDLSRRVTLILIKVEIDAHRHDLNDLKKMNVEVMRLGTVRLPEERR